MLIRSSAQWLLPGSPYPAAASLPAGCKLRALPPMVGRMCCSSPWLLSGTPCPAALSLALGCALPVRPTFARLTRGSARWLLPGTPCPAPPPGPVCGTLPSAGTPPGSAWLEAQSAPARRGAAAYLQAISPAGRPGKRSAARRPAGDNDRLRSSGHGPARLALRLSWPDLCLTRPSADAGGAVHGQGPASSVCFIPSCTGLLTAVLEDAHERLLQVLCFQCFEIFCCVSLIRWLDQAERATTTRRPGVNP